MEKISPNFWFGSRRLAGRNSDPAAIINATLRAGFGMLGPQTRLAERQEITHMRSIRERRNSVEMHFVRVRLREARLGAPFLGAAIA